MEEVLRIGEKEYYKTSSLVFEVPFKELRSIHFTDVPYYSTIEVLNLPKKKNPYQLSISATHSGGPRNEEFFLNFHITFHQPLEGSNSITNSLLAHRRIQRIMRLFAELVERGLVEEPNENRVQMTDSTYIGLVFFRWFTRKDDPILRDVMLPIINKFKQLIRSIDLLLFICHASEDKSFVDRLALGLDRNGLDVWYDKREIRVGESIVERINSGLGEATHLIVILSKCSASKSWVKRELSSSLMRQLGSNSIKIIPVLIQDCAIPLLLSDIKYADFRRDFERGLNELLDGVLMV